MFRLAMELWHKYDAKGTDWKNETEWKVGLGNLAGAVTIEDRDHPNHGEKVSFMAKDVYVMDKDGNKTPVSPGNPKWQGVILVKSIDKKGNIKTIPCSGIKFGYRQSPLDKDFIFLSAFSIPSSFLAHIAIFTPSLARAKAEAFPIPLLPPVINAVFPEIPNSIIFSYLIKLSLI